MKGKTLLLSTVLLALLALVAVSPAAAQGAGEVNVTVDPADATVSVGETQTYEVVVESPDNGILAYDDLILDVDPSVAEVVAFRENHTSNLSSSEITNDNSTLSLSASPEDDLKQPAPNSSYTLVEFDVTATAGGTTGINFNQSANAIITDFNDTAYSIGTLSGASLTAEAPPTFEVSNVQPADATVTNGTVIDVSAEVENTGDQQGTQDITLSVGSVTQTQSLALNASENGTVTFSNVDTGALGPGSYTHTVSSANDSASGNLTVQQPATFEVSNVQPADATVTNGTVIDVSADVENTGDQQGTQDITLSVGSVTQTQSLALNASENATVTFSNVDTGALGPGSYAHTVSSANDSDSGSLTVKPPFEVSNVQPADATVTNGTVIDVSAEVENVGTLRGAQDITLAVGGVKQTQSLALNASENGTVTFSNVDTGALGPGSYTHTVSSANDSASGNLTVQQPATFEVSNVQPADATVTNGTVIDVSAEVENTGDQQGTQDITLSVGGVTQTQSLALNASENGTVTFSNVDTGALGPGSYTHTVSSANDSASGNLTVQREASVTLDDQTVTAGSSTVTVNSTDLPDGGFVVIHDDNLTQGAGAVESVIGNSGYLSAGVSTDVTITIDRELQNETLIAMAHRDTDGDQTYDFVSSNGSVDGPYTDSQGAPITDPGTVTVEPVPATVRIDNQTFTGSTDQLTVSSYDFGSNGVALSIWNVSASPPTNIGEVVQTPSSGTDVTLNLTTTLDTSSNVIATVHNATPVTPQNIIARDSATVTLQASPDPANFAVSDLTPQTATVTQGDTLTVAANVTNTGDQQGSQVVSLNIGSVTSTQTVTLDGGQSTTVEFTNVDTSALAPGNYTHEITSANDSASGNLTVQGTVSVESFEVSATELTLGETLSVDATVRNTGLVAANLSVPLRVDGATVDTATVQVGANTSTTVTLQADSLSLGEANVSVAGLATRLVTVAGPALDDGKPATDPDDDGQYEDIDGDGTRDLVDVQTLFVELDNPLVTGNEDLFNFQPLPGVSVLDVQELFNELPE